VLLNENEKSDSRIAAINSLRRVIIHYIDSKWYYRPSTSLSSIKIATTGDDDQLDSSISSKQQELKRHEYNKWFQKQFLSIQSFLLQLLSHEDDVYQAVAIRTYIEFMKYDSLVQHGPTVMPSSSSSSFNEESWKSFIIAILICRKELDVDLLLMIKQEILIFHDFTYYSFSILIDMIAEIKLIHQQYLDKVAIMGSAIESSSTDHCSIVVNNYQVICQNCIDFLRILSVPELIDRANMWIPLSASKDIMISKKKKGKDAKKDTTRKDVDDDKTTMLSDSDLDDDPEVDDSTNHIEYSREIKEIDPLVAELAGLNRNNKKRKVDTKVPIKMMKKSIHEEVITMEQRLTDIIYYKKGFSKAWLMLLSLSFTSQQHKLILKHLPEHVIPNMRNPMLLADYLTQSYAIGGIVAILSLEGLFFLILNHNLDYPDFFLSLYNLCTIEVFSAKYRSKFMKLLSTSLKSVNIPVYLVCAFIKRLAHLALHTPSPNTQYYIAQITWLLRQHPQSRVLIHRSTESSSVDVNDIIHNHHHNGDFNNMESTNLLLCNAFQSSLWEIDSLQNHHLYQVASLAEALTQPLSTTVGPEAGTSYIHVEDYLNISYSDLIEKELATSKATTKKNASLAYKKPLSLFAADNIISKCFQVG